MLFEARYKTQNTRLLSILSPYIFSSIIYLLEKTEEGLLLLTLKGQFKLFIYLYSKDGFTYGHSIQYKCFLLVYMYIDLLKLKANKLFENSDTDLPWLLF